jgi:hypothetical protein
MPRLNLTPEQRQQLSEWINGGPTDPTGLNNWIGANCPNPTTGVNDRSCYQAIGERDFYQLMLDKDGSNIKRSDITQQMADALSWVADSLDAWEASGIPIPEHQGQMRPLWAFLRSL